MDHDLYNRTVKVCQQNFEKTESLIFEVQAIFYAHSTYAILCLKDPDSAERRPSINYFVIHLDKIQNDPINKKEIQLAGSLDPLDHWRRLIKSAHVEAGEKN